VYYISVTETIGMITIQEMRVVFVRIIQNSKIHYLRKLKIILMSKDLIHITTSKSVAFKEWRILGCYAVGLL
jgi:hypothetical protein